GGRGDERDPDGPGPLDRRGLGEGRRAPAARQKRGDGPRRQPERRGAPQELPPGNATGQQLFAEMLAELVLQMAIAHISPSSPFNFPSKPRRRSSTSPRNPLGHSDETISRASRTELRRRRPLRAVSLTR